MSYLKLFTTVQDHAVGYQSVNQARDNGDALKDLYDAKHQLGTNGYQPYSPTRSYTAIGRHDDIKIARSVADFVVDSTSFASPVLSIRVSGPIFGIINAARITTGQWRIFVSTPQRFSVVALVKASASSDRKATCYRASSINGPHVVVTTWNVATAAKVDYDFSLVLWAQRAL